VEENSCEPERMLELKSTCIVRDAWRRGCPVMRQGVNKSTLHACPDKECEVYKLFKGKE
jgi:hypothetical protein